MESYVIRVYRRESNDQLVGHLISASGGKAQCFHSVQELMEKLNKQISVVGHATSGGVNVSQAIKTKSR